MTSERNDSGSRDAASRGIDDCPTKELPASQGPRRRRQTRRCASIDEAPPTLTMGWARRRERDELRADEAATVVDEVPHTEEMELDDTTPRVVEWLDDEASLRDTVRDIDAVDRTQIIDMDAKFDDSAPVAEPADQEALTDLAGAVGHELNNPLTTCVGYLRQISSMVPPENIQMLEMIERLARNLNRIHSIVGELEMLAAEASDRQERVDLARVVARVHDQLSRFLHTDVDLQLRPAFLEADRPRIYQLVYVMLAGYMLDDEASAHCSVRVGERSVGACLEVAAACRPQGSLRLDLLGILRRNVVAGATPLGLAAQLTREMGGSWFEPPVDAGHRVTAILPRRSPLPHTDSHRRRPGSSPRPALPDPSATSALEIAERRFDQVPRFLR